MDMIAKMQRHPSSRGIKYLQVLTVLSLSLLLAACTSSRPTSGQAANNHEAPALPLIIVPVLIYPPSKEAQPAPSEEPPGLLRVRLTRDRVTP